MKPPSIILLTVSAWIMCSPFEFLRKQLCVFFVVVLMTMLVPTSSTFLTPHLLQIIKILKNMHKTLCRRRKKQMEQLFCFSTLYESLLGNWYTSSHLCKAAAATTVIIPIPASV